MSHFNEIKESPDDYEFVIGYGYDIEEAKEFKEKILKALQTISNIKDMDIYQIGATIGVHTGPYPLGLGVIKKYNK